MLQKPKFRVLLVFRRPSADTGAMLRGIAKYQRLHGQWTVFVDDDTGFEGRSEQLWGQEWDGVICAHTTPCLVKTCRERQVPLIDLTDGPHFSGIPQVRPDNIAVGHMAAEDLTERGYVNFGFCGFSNELWSRERQDGFREGLELIGRSCSILESENTCRYSPDWHEKQMPLIVQWLKRQPKPLAVLACHDHRAVQVLNAARLCGLPVVVDVDRVLFVPRKVGGRRHLTDAVEHREFVVLCARSYRPAGNGPHVVFELGAICPFDRPVPRIVDARRDFIHVQFGAPHEEFDRQYPPVIECFRNLDGRSHRFEFQLDAFPVDERNDRTP